MKLELATQSSLQTFSMASLTFTHFLSLPRNQLNLPFHPSLNLVQLQDFRVKNRWCLKAVPRKKIAETLADDSASEDEVGVKKKKPRAKRATTRTKKKPTGDTSDEDSEPLVSSDSIEVESDAPASSDGKKKTPRRSRKKATTVDSGSEEDQSEKKVRRRTTKKKDDGKEDQGPELDLSDLEELPFFASMDDKSEEDLELGEDNSFLNVTPLVCCFGAAQHAFVPSGRPANRLIDYEHHERMKDALWFPEKFFRAPGGSAASVALALARLGGNVAFMGKLGDDAYGEALLCYLIENNVRTRSVCIDSKRPTAVTQMKISKRGPMRTTSVKPCAEDSLSESEIDIDVLKEAKMFYVNTHSLLDKNMRSTTLQAIKISKKVGGVIFYDVNIPLPLWQSDEETKLFIQQVWNLADVIEITEQELEFLWRIKPSEEFDNDNNAKFKFLRYDPEVFAPLWHENLKVLFVTNGTSMIHYYTSEHNGAVRGFEDPPLTPFTGDMSESGNGIVAALMKMLTIQPQLITDKDYLKDTVQYAIDSGILDQWVLEQTRGYPPREDAEEEVTPDENGIRSISEEKYRTRTPSMQSVSKPPLQPVSTPALQSVS